MLTQQQHTPVILSTAGIRERMMRYSKVHNVITPTVYIDLCKKYKHLYRYAYTYCVYTGPMTARIGNGVKRILQEDNKKYIYIVVDIRGGKKDFHIRGMKNYDRYSWILYFTRYTSVGTWSFLYPLGLFVPTR